MAKKLLSFLKCPPTQNISIQVTDPEKICGCIKQLHQNNDLLRDIYDAYSGMVKVGEVKLRETDDTLTKMGVVLTNFDSSLKRWGGHLQRDAEQLREKEQRLERLKKEVEFDRKWLVEKRDEVPLKWQDHDYQKAMRVQKIKDCRAEQSLLEMKRKLADEQIEKVLENIEEAEGKYDSVERLRGNHSRAHKADLQNLIADWEESREKRDILQSLDIDPKTLISSLGYKEDWRAKDKELSELRNEHDMLRENVQDQQDRKDMLRLRNEELRKRILHNEVVLQNLRDEAKEEHWNRESPYHKHDDKHESSQKHGRSGASHRHHDKDGSSHRHSHRHHDHGTSHHRHHSHGKSHKDHEIGTSHKYGSRASSPPRHGSREGSPPRHQGHKEGTSQRHDNPTSHRSRGRDLSPQRHANRDVSPPRHDKRDGSPPHRHLSRDHGNKDGSHGNKDGTHGNRDGSHGNRNGPHGNREGSPPRYQDHYGTLTMPDNRVLSPRNRDGSPPRQGNTDGSLPKQEDRGVSHGSRERSPPRHDNRGLTRGNVEGPPTSRQEHYKDGTANRRGSRATSLKHGNMDGSSNIGIDTDGFTGSETRDGSYLQEQLSTSQFGSQTIVGHQSSTEDFTQL
ncbi:eukaryotic translation initiation factor 3 subunit A-like [Pecten maximus]|uniref:eukaryotic translation initiation factor 3 subunit A-like n=1 Tax=Pecten maximus TaxID=6579 RepID=UPI0014588AEC|nr:eukaryotic translation initiation factor 3 subunit A-like [Pecten maximus]